MGAPSHKSLQNKTKHQKIVFTLEALTEEVCRLSGFVYISVGVENEEQNLDSKWDIKQPQLWSCSYCGREVGSEQNNKESGCGIGIWIGIWVGV